MRLAHVVCPFWVGIGDYILLFTFGINGFLNLSKVSLRMSAPCDKLESKNSLRLSQNHLPFLNTDLYGFPFTRYCANLRVAAPCISQSPGRGIVWLYTPVIKIPQLLWILSIPARTMLPSVHATGSRVNF